MKTTLRRFIWLIPAFIVIAVIIGFFAKPTRHIDTVFQRFPARTDDFSLMHSQWLHFRSGAQHPDQYLPTNELDFSYTFNDKLWPKAPKDSASYIIYAYKPNPTHEWRRYGFSEIAHLPLLIDPVSLELSPPGDAILKHGNNAVICTMDGNLEEVFIPIDTAMATYHNIQNNDVLIELWLDDRHKQSKYFKDIAAVRMQRMPRR